MYVFFWVFPRRLIVVRRRFGTDIGFRNVGKQQSDAGEIPKRIHTILKLLVKNVVVNQFGRVAAYLSSPYWCVYSAQCTVRLCVQCTVHSETVQRQDRTDSERRF